MTRSTHPSNLLRESEVRDFPHALFLYVEQSRYEKELAESAGEDPWIWDRHIQQDQEAAARAEDIYRRHQRAAQEAQERETQAAVAEMREAGLIDLADALESGDYSELAI